MNENVVTSTTVNLLKSIQTLLNKSQIIEYDDNTNTIRTHDIKTHTTHSIPLQNLDNTQKIKTLSLIHNHNVEYVKFISNVMKQQIQKLKTNV